MTSSQDSWEAKVLAAVEDGSLINPLTGALGIDRLMALVNSATEEARQAGRDEAVEYILDSYLKFERNGSILILDRAGYLRVLEAAKHPSSRKEEGV